jgi:hypothetical protein
VNIVAPTDRATTKIPTIVLASLDSIMLGGNDLPLAFTSVPPTLAGCGLVKQRPAIG